jgi:predicted enzyme related to lactoylglutathione lyase
MRNQHGDFIWYELLTTDLNAAVKFYKAVLDWEVEDSGHPDMEYRLGFADDAPIAGLMKMPQDASGPGAQPAWVGYVAVDDVDQAVAKIQATGGAVQIPAFDVAEVGRCGWNELAAKNLDGALKFYGEQFGWTAGSEIDIGDMETYKFFEHKGNAIGGMMKANDNAGPAVWSFYFRVADIDAAAEKIAAAGGKILHGPAQVPGDDFAINGLDPQGVLFALVGRRTNMVA